MARIFALLIQLFFFLIFSLSSFFFGGGHQALYFPDDLEERMTGLLLGLLETTVAEDPAAAPWERPGRRASDALVRSDVGGRVFLCDCGGGASTAGAGTSTA